VDEDGKLVGDTIIVEDGRIRGVGTGLTLSYAKHMNINGYVLPGFVDAHLHLTGLGLNLHGADLRGSSSVSDIMKGLSSTTGPVAYGSGWDHELLSERRYPTRAELDAAVPDRPAIAVRVCGHLAVANTIALALSKPWTRYPEFVDKETGVLLEDAVYYTIERVLSAVDVRPIIASALAKLSESGLAGVSSMTCNPREAEALAYLERLGKLEMRVACYSPPDQAEYTASVLEGHSLASFAGIKLFADGSLGARTAFLTSDYEDDRGNRGLLLMDKDLIGKWIGYAQMRGWRAAIHAIGDAALDEVIQAISSRIGESHIRVEHASVARNDQISALSSLGVHVVVQPHFRVTDWWIEDRLGRRVRLAYRLRSMLEAGVRLALSTDSPVEPYDPVETFKAAVGLCHSITCVSEESLRPNEVIRLYTAGSADASGGAVASLGRISKGLPAVLSWTPDYPLKESWNGPLLRLDLEA